MDDLNELMKASETVEFEKKEFEELPDGTYPAIINAVKFTQTKNTGKPMFVWEFIIDGGKFNGRKEWKNQVLNDPTSMAYLRLDLKAFGIVDKEIELIEAKLDTLLDVQLDITIAKNEKGFRNIYLKPLK